eukprot:gnl/MRDRNA2_/MRDRNA2_70631_c0_seq1.p1 gnl/MRDRNA2_/MRDRNA2_70631_c0~~gnl/MRDRNA2_/MRDRNA2_70631_c0_seq1.p1  ORF type:complete len:567 (-),score=119.17 gnl/MRDRNA2_/MRDRNA2_70631_c0_seq1:6-1706(-)
MSSGTLIMSFILLAQELVNQPLNKKHTQTVQLDYTMLLKRNRESTSILSCCTCPGCNECPQEVNNAAQPIGKYLDGQLRRLSAQRNAKMTWQNRAGKSRPGKGLAKTAKLPKSVDRLLQTSGDKVKKQHALSKTTSLEKLILEKTKGSSIQNAERLKKVWEPARSQSSPAFAPATSGGFRKMIWEETKGESASRHALSAADSKIMSGQKFKVTPEAKVADGDEPRAKFSKVKAKLKKTPVKDSNPKGTETVQTSTGTGINWGLLAMAMTGPGSAHSKQTTFPQSTGNHLRFSSGEDEADEEVKEKNNDAITVTTITVTTTEEPQPNTHIRFPDDEGEASSSDHLEDEFEFLFNDKFKAPADSDDENGESDTAEPTTEGFDDKIIHNITWSIRRRRHPRVRKRKYKEAWLKKVRAEEKEYFGITEADLRRPPPIQEGFVRRRRVNYFVMMPSFPRKPERAKMLPLDTHRRRRTERGGRRRILKAMELRNLSLDTFIRLKNASIIPRYNAEDAISQGSFSSLHESEVDDDMLQDEFFSFNFKRSTNKKQDAGDGSCCSDCEDLRVSQR